MIVTNVGGFMAKKICDEDNKADFETEDILRKLKRDTDAMFKPSKKDTEEDRKLRALEKESVRLQNEYDREEKKILGNVERGITKAEKILKKNPEDKVAAKALRDLKSIKSRIQKSG